MRPKLAGLLGEIKQDRSGLHEPKSVVGIDDRRDLVVGRDGEKVGMELVVLADVDRVHPIWQPHFFQHD